jgi:hypothetical protein
VPGEVLCLQCGALAPSKTLVCPQCKTVIAPVVGESEPSGAKSEPEVTKEPEFVFSAPPVEVRKLFYFLAAAGVVLAYLKCVLHW